MNERYFDVVERILREAREVNHDAIHAAAKIIADAIAADGIVRTFGTGHSELLAREMFDRAGGLAPIDVILDVAHGRAENLEGYAAALLHEDQLRPPDCLIVASTSGRAGTQGARHRRDIGFLLARRRVTASIWAATGRSRRCRA